MSESTEVFEGVDDDGKFVCNIHKVSKEIKEVFLPQNIPMDIGDYIYASLNEPGMVYVFKELEEVLSFGRNDSGAVSFNSVLFE